MSKPKAVGYIRVSTATQVDGESLDGQRELIKAEAIQEGLDLVDIIADEGISGSKSDRPGVTKVMELARTGAVQVVIVSRLSRFGRSTADVLSKIEKLQQYNVRFVSCKETKEQKTPTDRMTTTMLAAVAEFEREVIREQMMEGRDRKWKRKEIFQGHPPFGWVWNKGKKCLELHPQQSEILKQIVSLYLNNKMPLKKIALKLKEQGIKGSRGAYPKSAHISQWLKNSILYGVYITNTAKPESEWIIYDAPPLISKTDFDRIQDQTERNTFKVGRPCKELQDRWAANILVCGICGGKIKPKVGNSRKDGSRPAYYSCCWAEASASKRAEVGMFQCPLPSRRAELVESEILREILYRFTFGNKNAKELQEEFRSRFGSLEEQLKPISDQVKHLQQKRLKQERAVARFNEALVEVDDGFSVQTFRQGIRIAGEEIRTIEAEIAELEAQRIVIKKQHAEQGKFQAWLDSAGKLADDVYKTIKGLSPQDLKCFVEGVVEGRIAVSGYNAGDGVTTWTYVCPKGPRPFVEKWFTIEGVAPTAPTQELEWTIELPKGAIPFREKALKQTRLEPRINPETRGEVPYLNRSEKPVDIKPWSLRFNPEVLDKIFGVKKGSLKSHGFATPQLR